MGLVVSCAASVVTSCAAACACCACSELCRCCVGLPGCCSTDNGSGHSTKRGSTTIKYFVLFTLSVVAAIVLRYRNDGVVKLYTVSWNACTSNECIGYGAVYRISFALFLFFLLHALALLFAVFARVDRIRWWWHYLLYVGLLVAAFAIPSPFYDQAWVNIARFVSAFFLFFQIVILIDFAYEWNESWTSEERGWFAPLLAVSAAAMAGCIVLWVFYFRWFGGGGCPRNNFLISWTVIQCVLATALAISPIAEGNGGILPAAVLSLYMTWLAYSGLESDPDLTCNSLSSQDTLHLILGLIIGALSLVYAAWNVSTNNTLFGGEEEIPVNEAAQVGDIELAQHTPAANGASHTLSSAGNDAFVAKVDTLSSPGPSSISPASPTSSPDDDSARHLARRNLRLHVLMALASSYMAMLLTNWGSSQQASDSDSDSQQAYDQGTESLFIKFATQWLTFFTFVWALIAPRVLTDREFRTR